MGSTTGEQCKDQRESLDTLLRKIMENSTVKEARRTIQKFIEKLKSEEFSSAVNEALLPLAQRGWFVTPDMRLTAPLKMAKLIMRGDVYEVDQAMTCHFEGAMPHLIGHLQKLFPQRRRLVDAAFMAHRLRLYDFSIPLLLAQADGVGNDIFGFSPYTRQDKNVTKLHDMVETQIKPDGFMGKYWQLIYSLLPIHASPRDIEKFDDPLNRHEVLHGLRCDYGNQTNSCKAFSWLIYVASFKGQINMTMDSDAV